LEYTLPDVSQSVIITRMAGRTPVPEREEIASLAKHHATMVIFLSAGMVEKLTERLLAGGYQKHTPAAIVYKATWEEEETYVCTLETLAETAKDHGITKTALILVGDVVTHSSYRRSGKQSETAEYGKHYKFYQNGKQPCSEHQADCGRMFK